MKRTVRKNIGIFMLAIVMLCSLIFSACDFLFSQKPNDIWLKVDILNLNVGQSVTIDSAYYDIYPSSLADEDKEITLSSGDEQLLGVDGLKATAIASGKTHLTITAKSNTNIKGSMVVNIVDVDPIEISIMHSGQLFQQDGQTSNVLFNADFGAVSAPGKNVNWSVNSGEDVLDEQTLQAKDSFSFMPQGYGRYTIGASTQSKEEVLSASVDINVYKPYISAPVVTSEGSFVQEEGNYSYINFNVNYTDDPQNPDRVISWLVNGKEKSQSKTFSFKPTNAGEYEVQLVISGEKFNAGTVTARGSVVPKNVRLDFDNCYPDVFVLWDCAVANLGYQVQVRDEQNRLVHEVDISTAHSATSQLFSGMSVNLSSIIGMDNDKNIFTNAFKIQVKSLGGGGFVESGYSEPLITKKMPSSSQKYLEKKYFDGAKNYFISDEDEFVDFMAYCYLWRDEPILNGKYDVSEHEVYVDFEVVNIKALVSYASSALHFTGRTSTSCTLSNNILKMTISFETDSLPSKSTSIAESGYMGGIGSVRPHVDYDKYNTRKSLPIDSVANGVEVETSEQLYYIAQLGFRPIPKEGSTAEEIYNYARTVLLQIINESMTQLQKAHAIYDWIMWQVNYDYSVLSISSLAESVRYSAYYLEGVFNDSWNYAVCDALAKAYALMCNMERIPCIRVAGIAGEAAPDGADIEAWIGVNWGGHAWNKVKLGDEWYIVDLTWGDESIAFSPDGHAATKYYEFAFHRYFLLTDKEVENMRREDEPNNYPRTATVPFNFYAQSFVYEGVTYDSYFNSDEAIARAKAESLTTFMHTAIQNGKKDASSHGFDPMYSKRNEAEQYFPGSPKNQYVSNNFVAFDYKISLTLKDAFNPNDPSSAFRKALRDRGYTYRTDFYMYDVSSFGYYYLFIIIRI